MSALDDVCWHEAGHGTMAAIHGLMVMRIIVRQNQSLTDWDGFHHVRRAHPESRLKVLAGGMAGQLIYKATAFSLASQQDLNDAKNRSSDDEVKYNQIAASRSNALPFIKEVETNCWNALSQSHKQHADLANELLKRQKVGPLVYCEIMSGLSPSQASRDADDKFLLELEKVSPSPPTPP